MGRILKYLFISPTKSYQQVATGVTEAVLTEMEYQFIQPPSKDFFCPVTFGLLLQPHQTTCCGHHLSDEAAARIQRAGGACPMCKNQSLATTPDIYFRRQVHALYVFCRHKERGCGWEGELSALEHHVDACPWKNSPLLEGMEKISL